MSYKNGSMGLKTHALDHKNKIETIKVKFKIERNKKKRKFQKKLVLQIRSHLKIMSKRFYIPL